MAVQHAHGRRPVGLDRVQSSRLQNDHGPGILDKLPRPSATVLLLFLFALAMRVLTALPTHQPGYMDAYYYYNGAESLYRGQGFRENFIWNYLDGPQGLPHPSHLYWMPLASVLIYPFFLVFGASYRVAQMPFILLSSLLPLITYHLGRQTSSEGRHALGAALLTVFSGFYTAYWVSPDNFAPFAVTASLSLWLMGAGLSPKGRGSKRGSQLWFFALAGLFAGLSHLARADGPLLLVALAVVVAFEVWRHKDKRGVTLAGLLLALVGYLVVMAPWFYRNWRAIGVPLSPAGTKTLFLRSYDDLYSYGRELTWSSYLAWGWGPILRSKLEACWLNLQNVLASDLLIFLAPFAAIGLWGLRRRIEYQVFFVYGTLLYLAMSLAFTFPGVRGGMFHSGSALLPFLFAAAMAGLDTAIAWVARRRPRWHAPTAQVFFSVGFVGLAVLVSGFVYQGRVLGRGGLSDPAWNHDDAVYHQIAAWLGENAPPEAAVLVNNAPSFHYHSHRPCLSIPNEELETVIAVARRYGARYLVLEQNHPRPLQALYLSEEEEPYPGLNLILTLGDVSGEPVKVYSIDE